MLLSARSNTRIASSAARLCKGMIYINTIANSIRYRCLLGLFWKETLTMKRLVPILLAAAAIGLAGPAMAVDLQVARAPFDQGCRNDLRSLPLSLPNCLQR